MSLDQKARGAAKWSLLTELIARTIAPITQLILARLLAPEAFGIVATVVMVTSFAEMLADAGFQKYLIQREFKNKEMLDRNADVAFWSALTVALALLAVIGVFRDPLAAFVGNPGLGVPLLIASIAIPLTAISSVQMALFRRAFEFKKLLPIRVGTSLVTLVVAVPLALFGFDYWSLILGALASSLAMAVALTVASRWKPNFFFSFAVLREMFSFSGWSLLEAISIWLTTWAGVFVVSNLLTPHELGLYRQPMTIVNSTFALVTSATTPILFSALSRLQSQREQFKEFFSKFQLIVGMVVLPLGVGAFFYRDFLTHALFGDQWADAALMFGLWSLSTGFMIVLSHYASEVFRSLGKPRVSMFAQILYMLVMIPAIYFAALDGFIALVIVNSLVRVAAIVINQILLHWVAGISFLRALKNLSVPLIASTVMGALAAALAAAANGEWGWSILGIVTCVLVYVALCLCFRRPRRLLLKTLRNRSKSRP